MKIESIRLRNYKCHADLKVHFQPSFNAIVGVNGSGKTSLLNAICDVLTGLFSNYLQLSHGNYRPLDGNNIARLEVEVIQGRYSFEPQYPVEVAIVAQAFGVQCLWSVYTASTVQGYGFTGQLPGHVWRSQHEQGNATPIALPLVAFYRANRHWNQPQPHEMQAATARNSIADGYASWWNASLDSTALQSWAIGKCLERFQTSSETGVAFDAIDSDELAQVNRALAVAVEGATGMKYDLKQKSLLVEWAPELRRDPTAFENLSDGQRAVIGLVADIARRMCMLNPQLGQGVTNQTPGVVLVDELDMHLHPRWQRILTSGLQRAFPQVQFIVASHSPQVLGELQPEQIILLRAAGAGTTHPQVSYGLSSSQVLEEVMGAESRTPEVEALRSTVFKLLERGDLPQARQKLAELEATAPGIPEIAGAQALLRRKEVLGR